MRRSAPGESRLQGESYQRAVRPFPAWNPLSVRRTLRTKPGSNAVSASHPVGFSAVCTSGYFPRTHSSGSKWEAGHARNKTTRSGQRNRLSCAASKSCLAPSTGLTVRQITILKHYRHRTGSSCVRYGPTGSGEGSGICSRTHKRQLNEEVWRYLRVSVPSLRLHTNHFCLEIAKIK